MVNFDDVWLDDHPCYGHNPTDIQPFHDLFLGSKDEEGRRDSGFEDGDGTLGGDPVMPVKKYYTNEMLYELLRPDGMASPYVYNHFVWSHCDVSFGGLPSRQKGNRCIDSADACLLL